MEITGVHTQYHYNLPSAEKSKSNNDNPDLFETFKNESLKWAEKVKDEISEQLENDSEKNIKMSDKQWRSLMNHVDSAIADFKENVKEQKEESQEQKKSEAGSGDSRS